ncbi:MAG: DUF4147 domain-containing protein [Patescibacteria group bacterium]
MAIIEAGLVAIDTKKIVQSSISLEGEILKIKDIQIDLREFRGVKVIGFGKASSEAAVELEKILGEKITDGAIIDINTGGCQRIKEFIGTHPHPSPQNISAAKQLLEIAEGADEKDLVLVIVSGGGSALLCWPEEECKQGEMLYEEFLKIGGTIEELNVVRKHLSSLKGGGLAKALYPARVVGLIFCDVPGGGMEEVASGPTFKDSTTTQDAETLLDKYNFKGFKLNETPKEDKYFERVTNLSLISNLDALQAMSQKAKEFGFEPKILSSQIYDLPEVAVDNFKKLLTKGSAVIGGGEIKLIVKSRDGSGGRCVQLALASLKKLGEGETFTAIASDGLDNSDVAGAIVDKNTLEAVSRLNLDTEDYLQRVDSYNFFKQTGDLVFTGQTGANVSDLMLWIKE